MTRRDADWIIGRLRSRSRGVDDAIDSRGRAGTVVIWGTMVSWRAGRRRSWGRRRRVEGRSDRVIVLAAGPLGRRLRLRLGM